MRQDRFPPFGFEFSEFGLWELSLVPFWAFRTLVENRFWRRGSQKMRQDRFPPFGFVSAEFGRRKLNLVSFWAFEILVERRF